MGGAFALHNLVQVVDWQGLASSLVSSWPVWLGGMLVGMLLPRQSILFDFLAFATSSLGAGSSAISALLSQAIAAIHGAMFVQSVRHRHAHCRHPRLPLCLPVAALQPVLRRHAAAYGHALAYVLSLPS